MKKLSKIYFISSVAVISILFVVIFLSYIGFPALPKIDLFRILHAFDQKYTGALISLLVVLTILLFRIVKVQYDTTKNLKIVFVLFSAILIVMTAVYMGKVYYQRYLNEHKPTVPPTHLPGIPHDPVSEEQKKAWRESKQISIEQATVTHTKWLTEANYCKEDSDCVGLSDFAYYSGQCFAVNKDKALSLSNHSDPKSLVSYCDPKNPLACVDGKCHGGTGVMPGYIHPIYVADFSKNDILIGASHNVFVGRVIKQSGEKALGSTPETQFKVEIISNIKGELKGTVTVNQFGGYKNGTFVTVEDDTPMPNGKSAGTYMLEPGATYLLATRYNEQEDWYTLNSFPTARKLLSKDANANIADLKTLAQNDERVKALTAAYPNEKLLDADIQHNNTRNNYKEYEVKIQMEQARISTPETAPVATDTPPVVVN
jgi:hypothetical protein